MRFFVYDLETTGVKHWRNCIHQLAYSLVIGGQIVKQGDLKIAPHPKAVIEPAALEVSGVTEEDLKTYEPQKVAHELIIDTLDEYVDRYDKTDKLHLMGYNNRSFDDQFFRAFFKQCGDPYFGSWFWSDSIDVMVLASNHLRHQRHMMENFKLSTVAETLGIEVEEDRLHDAFYDLELTYKIYEIVNGTK